MPKNCCFVDKVSFRGVFAHANSAHLNVYFERLASRDAAKFEDLFLCVEGRYFLRCNSLVTFAFEDWLRRMSIIDESSRLLPAGERHALIAPQLAGLTDTPHA